ncbi:hypothetical protein FPQ18DRAFT_313836 [Pyronema domesticum]|nr:hypothetical protein FPQ18DRAFT_313836 [Pyronema domesticum]
MFRSIWFSALECIWWFGVTLLGGYHFRGFTCIYLPYHLEAFGDVEFLGVLFYASIF